MGNKLNKVIPLILLSFFLFQIQSFAQIKDASATRGVWMWGSTLSGQDHDVIVNKLADNYVSEVYLLVKGSAGSKTSADLLNNFISRAHAKNIKVHFWYVVNSDGIFYSQHKDACIYHCPKPSAGYPNPYPMSDERLNILYPGYKEYVLDNIKYFINNFDLDGIHLDYIRYAHLVYSFDKDQLAKAASLGCDTLRLLNLFRNNYDYYASNDGFVNAYTNGDSDVVRWVNMRKNIVYDYIKSIKDTMQHYKPKIELTASFMPEGAYIPDYADVYYSQNYALNSPLLKKIFPMSYFKSYGKTTEWLKTVTEGAINLVNPSCKISAGIQTDNSVTAAQIGEQINFALSGGSYGAVAFRYELISNDQWKVIKSLYGNATGVKNNTAATPAEFNLKQNFPNPFNPSTVINFQLAKSGFVSLQIYDILGREIKTLLNQNMETGIHNINFDAQGLPSGIYLYKLKTDGFTSVKKMMLMK